MSEDEGKMKLNEHWRQKLDKKDRPPVNMLLHAQLARNYIPATLVFALCSGISVTRFVLVFS